MRHARAVGVRCQADWVYVVRSGATGGGPADAVEFLGTTLDGETDFVVGIDDGPGER